MTGNGLGGRGDFREKGNRMSLWNLVVRLCEKQKDSMQDGCVVVRWPPASLLLHCSRQDRETVSPQPPLFPKETERLALRQELFPKGERGKEASR